MTPPVTVTQICDQRACPAPARRTLLIDGQDFYFCDHHSTAVERVLTVRGTVRWMAVPGRGAEARAPLPRRTAPAVPPQRTSQQR